MDLPSVSAAAILSSPSTYLPFWRRCTAYTTDLVCGYILNESLSSPSSSRPSPMSLFDGYTKSTSNRLDPLLPDVSPPDAYPYCSWRFMYSQLSRSASPWNVAYPDQNSVYHASLLHLYDDEFYTLKSDSLPYVRYFSVQTYDATAEPLGSLRDYQLWTEVGTGGNPYEELGKVVDREGGGGFSVKITANGGYYPPEDASSSSSSGDSSSGSGSTSPETKDPSDYVNVLPALGMARRAGFFFVFVRLYDPEPFPESVHPTEKDHPDTSPFLPISTACYGPAYGSVDGTPYDALPPQEQQHLLKEAERWGWMCPPRILHTVPSSDPSLSPSTRDIPYCSFERTAAATEYDQTALPSRPCLLMPNARDNLFLPSNTNTKGLFRNFDANYLTACAEQAEVKTTPLLKDELMVPRSLRGVGKVAGKNGGGGGGGDDDDDSDNLTRRRPSGQTLWARIRGVLPVTPNSIYFPPYVANQTDYELRYVSISSYNRSPPGLVFKTLKDHDIVDHYTRPREDGSGSVEPTPWPSRSYEVWLGPSVDSMPFAARHADAMFLPWAREVTVLKGGDGTEYSYGDVVPYSGILYREILAMSQVLGDDATYGNAVADILSAKCVHYSEVDDLLQSGDLENGEDPYGPDNLGRPYCFEETCCGDRPPACCRERRHISEVMGNHYPRIDYFWKRDRPEKEPKKGSVEGNEEGNEEEEAELIGIGGSEL